MLDCPAMQGVRDRYPALLSPAKSTMQLFMWQLNIVGVAHTSGVVLRCLVPSMMHLHQPWRLERCNSFIRQKKSINISGIMTCMRNWPWAFASGWCRYLTSVNMHADGRADGLGSSYSFAKLSQTPLTQASFEPTIHAPL